MANIILIAGTFHGGWYWNPIVPALEATGHKVFTPTLSGLDPNVPVHEPINLDTHISDVLQIIHDNSLTNVVLVGWSYGGMVITGVADRTTARVDKLIYLDGQLPSPGQPEWDLMPDNADWIKMCVDGISFHPDERMLSYEPRTQPHPVGTKLQPLHYEQGKFDALDKVFVFAQNWSEDPAVTSPIEVSYLKASESPGWRVESWAFGHDLVRQAGAKVTELILQETSA